LGLKSNGTNQLLVYADNTNVLGDTMVALKKNTEILSKEVGLEANREN
jgi:hypothetical protein